MRCPGLFLHVCRSLGMRSTEDEMDVRIGFSFIDCVLRTIPPGELVTYLVLRRFVWRGKSGPLAPLYQAGMLCCSIRQKRISELSGISLTVTKEHLAALKNRRWVETRRIEDRDELLYVLGERAQTAGEKFEGEIFYADSLVEQEVVRVGGGRNPARGWSESGYRKYRRGNR